MKVLLCGSKYLSVAMLIVVVILVYYPGLSGSFVFDDKPNILDNPALQLFDGSFSSLVSASLNGVASPLGRPLSMASFALNLHFDGLDPFYFKLVNLAIHLANGVLIFVLMQQLWPRLTEGDKSPFAGLWVAAVWLLHPINLTPVLFVTQRMTSLAAFFTVAALLIYLYGRQTTGSKGWVAIAFALLVCFPAALMCKETALLLPFYILICEWLVLGSFRSVSPRSLWLVAFGLGVVIVGVLLTAWSFVAGGYLFRDFGLVERLMTESRVLWFYLRQLLLPWPDIFSLHHDDFVISRGLFSPPQTFLAILGWLTLITFAINRRRKYPLFAFAVAWFLAAHALESTILPLEIAYEHRNYLASFGVLVWVAAILFAPHYRDQGKVPKLVLAASFLVYCGLVTTLRAAQWGNEYRRTQIEATVHPNSARANSAAGVSLMENTFLSSRGGNSVAYQTARFYFKRAADIDKNSKAPLINLLYLDCVAGAPKDEGLQNELHKRFSTSAFPPGDIGLVQSLSELLVENRLCLNDAEVQTLLDAALSNPAARSLIRGMIFTVAMDYAVAKVGSLSSGLRYAKAAVDSDPGNVPFRINLVRILLASGNKVEALEQYQTLSLLHIAPMDKLDYDQIGRALSGMEKSTSTPNTRTDSNV